MVNARLFWFHIRIVIYTPTLYQKDLKMRLKLTAALTSVFFSAALAAPAQELPVRPLTEATNGSLPALVNIGPKSAGLTFKSSVPIACTVVYGKTRDFGMISNDPDMASLVTLNHNPVLGKLEPETKYYFRVQGVSAQGIVYAGDIREFTTSAVAKMADGLRMLSASVMTVSSNYGNGKNDSAWGANSALDGDPSTAWSSNGDGNDAYLVLDLGQSQQIEFVNVWTRTMSNNTAKISKLTITTDSGKVFGPFTLPDAKKPYRFEVKATTKTLRLDAVDSNGGNTGLIEIAVMGH